MKPDVYNMLREMTKNNRELRRDIEVLKAQVARLPFAGKTAYQALSYQTYESPTIETPTITSPTLSETITVVNQGAGADSTITSNSSDEEITISSILTVPNAKLSANTLEIGYEASNSYAMSLTEESPDLWWLNLITDVNAEVWMVCANTGTGEFSLSLPGALNVGTGALVVNSAGDGNVKVKNQLNLAGGTTYKVEADGDAVFKDVTASSGVLSGVKDNILRMNSTDDGYVYTAFEHSTVRKAFIGIDSTPNIRINAEAGDVRIYTTSTIRLYDETRVGDGGTTNYIKFASDGELTLAGTARVTRTMWLPFNALKAPGTKPATFKEWGISGVWEFSDATDDTVVFNMQMPYDMDKSVAPVISIGWSTNTAVTTETASWSLEYLYTQAGEDTTVGGATVTQTSNAIAQADGLIVVSFPALAVPHASDVCLHAQLKRLGADAVHDDLTDTAELHGVCLSYTSNKLGTAT